MYILAIESSCDDTSAAVLRDGILLSNVTASQAVHEEYGGVVPELASRAHQQNIVPVVSAAIKRAGIMKEDLGAVAFTRGPGLLGSLLVGVSFAKGFARSLGIPMIDVNHLQGHVLAHFIRESEDDHDQPVIDKLARQGNPEAFEFSKPDIAGYDYSFSGLKTSFLYHLRDWVKEDPDFIEHHKEDLAASLEKTIVDILMKKLRRAVKDTGIRQVAVAGGVSANTGLRNAFLDHAKRYHWKIFIPKFSYTTDNAAMIGITGYFKYLDKDFASIDLPAYARMEKI